MVTWCKAPAKAIVTSQSTPRFDGPVWAGSLRYAKVSPAPGPLVGGLGDNWSKKSAQDEAAQNGKAAVPQLACGSSPCRGFGCHSQKEECAAQPQTELEQQTATTQLDARRAEPDEALAQHQAMAEVLQFINNSPGDPGSVFDAMLEKAMRACAAGAGALAT